MTISFSFVQSVPCGSSGVACSKSVMLRLGSPGTEESITLTRHKKIPIGKFSERYFCFLFSYTTVSTTYQTCPISNRVSRNHPSKEPRRVLSLSSHLFVLLIAVRPKNKCSNHISYLEQYTHTRD